MPDLDLGLEVARLRAALYRILKTKDPRHGELQQVAKSALEASDQRIDGWGEVKNDAT